MPPACSPSLVRCCFVLLTRKTIRDCVRFVNRKVNYLAFSLHLSRIPSLSLGLLYVTKLLVLVKKFGGADTKGTARRALHSLCQVTNL